MIPGQQVIYQLTDERQKELWNHCVFVFDTSALLSLYLYPEEARQQIYTEVFEKIKDRLWIPHHVLFEFLKNKAAKIREPITRSYRPLKDDYVKPIVDAFQKSLNRIDALKNNIRHGDSHPFMVAEDIEKYEVKLRKFMQTTEAFEKAFDAQMEEKVNGILQLEKRDTVYEAIERYFKVGREYTHDEIMKITLEGKHRYEFKIPPGYEDLKDKIGTQIFGDLILWKQILEYAREQKTGVVFICNDVKEDWWNLVSDKKNEKRRPSGPRKELIKEFKDTTGGGFWMYNQARFLDLANTLITSNIFSRHIEQASRFLATQALDKYLAYTCDTCKQIGTVDTASLNLDFETAEISVASNPAIENRYLSTTEFACSHCHAPIRAQFEVWESPLGVINHQQTELKGASLLKDQYATSSLLFEDDDANDVPFEETVIIHKKRLHLSAGKPRKLVFPKPVDAHDTVFTIENIKPADPHEQLRLLVEGRNARKQTISRTLVPGNTTLRFVLRHGDEFFDHELKSIQLTVNANAAMSISVTEFPGTGRYIEKLYY